MAYSTQFFEPAKIYTIYKIYTRWVIYCIDSAFYKKYEYTNISGSVDPKLPKHGSYLWGTLVHPDPAQFDLRASGYFFYLLIKLRCFLRLEIRTPNEKNILRIVAVLYESKSGSRHTYPSPNPDITTNVVNINLHTHSYIYYFWAY